MRKNFEEFKKDNKELNTAELSFEAQEEDPSTPRLFNNDQNSTEETKKCAEKINVAEEEEQKLPEKTEPESVMDRQMDLLMNRLVGLINEKR